MRNASGALLLAFGFLTCCAGTVPAPKHTQADAFRAISLETVALVKVGEETGNIYPFCSGVWLGPAVIVTAAHCVEDEGETLSFIVEDDVSGYLSQPWRKHEAKLRKVDKGRDLALLDAKDPPAHLYASIGEEPRPGDVLRMVGQDSSFYWTCVTGTFSRKWPSLGLLTGGGPWHQIMAPVAHGMSGSGAFDEEGRLVGILSATMNVPDMAFYTPGSSVRAFIGGS